MVFLHVSDLHIGKKLCGKSLIEDQRHILNEILDMAAQSDVDAVLIAGDLYDKSQPGGEAVELASGFLTALSRLGKPAFIVSGNHDSAEQVAYCAGILSGANIFVSPAFSAVPRRHVLRDGQGEVHVYLLPFIRPAQVRRAFPEKAAQIKSYADALEAVVDAIELDPSARNVLVAHQFVVGGEMVLTDSEERMVGGVDAVPAQIFSGFDYVALGHLHAPQRAGGECIRYAGSPLKYSLSEEKQKKAALKVSLHAGQAAQIERLPYHPLRDVRSIRGELNALICSEGVEKDYVFITLTDELPTLDAAGALLQKYPNFVQARLENSRSGHQAEIMAENVEDKTPLEHFTEFFTAQNGGLEPSAAQLKLMQRIIEEAQEGLNASH